MKIAQGEENGDSPFYLVMISATLRLDERRRAIDSSPNPESRCAHGRFARMEVFQCVNY